MDGHKNLGDISHKNVFIVGDIHGEFDFLIHSLKQIGFDKTKDLLVSTGDLVDRGPRNIECMLYTLDEFVEGVGGNHDRMMMKAIRSQDVFYKDFWRQNGGSWGMDLSPVSMEPIFKLLEAKLSTTLEFQHNGKKYLISHAAFPNEYVVSERYTAEQIKFITQDRTIHHKGSSAHPNYDYLIHGHTYNADVSFDNNRIYIDTGCVFGRSLSFIVLRSDGTSYTESVKVYD